MEDLWTILIIVGVVVFKLIKSAADKKVPEEIEEPDAPVIIIDQPIETIPQKPKKKHTKQTVAEKSYNKEEQHINNIQSEPHSEQHNDEEHATITAEEIRKAVVWAEILERKYN